MSTCPFYLGIGGGLGVVAKSVFFQYLVYEWHDSDDTLKYRQTYRLSVPRKFLDILVC